MRKTGKARKTRFNFVVLADTAEQFRVCALSPAGLATPLVENGAPCVRSTFAAARVVGKDWVRTMNNLARGVATGSMLMVS